MNPDRVVIGTESDFAKDKLTELYLPFVNSKEQILATDIASSELIKYAANSFLATKISFINEISNLAEATGGNILDVAKGMGMDGRIGPKFLQAGVGYGGSCFPKDVAALEFQGREAKLDLEIVKATRRTNFRQRELFIDKIEKYFQQNPYLKKDIAVLGLAFKPETDDVRESPAIDVIKTLTLQEFKTTSYDPKALETFPKFNPDLETEYVDSYQKAVENKEVVIILTDWKEFGTAEFLEYLKKQGVKAIFDGRNMFDLTEMEKQDFDYISIGRKQIIKN